MRTVFDDFKESIEKIKDNLCDLDLKLTNFKTDIILMNHHLCQLQKDIDEIKYKHKVDNVLLKSDIQILKNENTIKRAEERIAHADKVLEDSKKRIEEIDKQLN